MAATPDEARLLYACRGYGAVEREAVLAALADGAAAPLAHPARIDARPTGVAQALLGASRFADLAAAIRRSIAPRGRTLVVLLERAGALHRLAGRSFHHAAGHVGRLVVRTLDRIEDATSAVRDLTRRLFGAEGHVLAWGEDSGTFVVRGDGLGAADGLPVGALFALHRRVVDASGRYVSYPPRHGCYVVYTGPSGGVRRGRLVGRSSARPGDLLLQVDAGPGIQEFLVTDERGEPQPGYSLYVTSDRPSTALEHYVGTSGRSGRLRFRADRPGPYHFNLILDVEGIDFSFESGVFHVRPEHPIVLQVASDSHQMQLRARQIRSARIDREGSERLQREVKAYMREARISLAAGRYGKAVMALRRAIGLLSDLKHPKAQELLRLARQAQKRSLEKIARRKAKAILQRAQRMVAAAEGLFFEGNLERAAQEIGAALGIWPAKVYPQGLERVRATAARLAAVRVQTDTPLGRARRTLLASTARLAAGAAVSPDQLAAIDEAARTLARQGDLDPKTPLGDLEVLLRAKLGLDRLHARLTMRAGDLKTRYEKLVDAGEREKVYDEYQGVVRDSDRVSKLIASLPSFERGSR